MQTNLFEQIRKKVEEIPVGKVTTYGAIAKALNIKDTRKIGWALHQNKQKNVCPCHRVVNIKGELAKGYVFGGEQIQKQLLVSEGVTFTNPTTINLAKHLHVFNKN